MDNKNIKKNGKTVLGASIGNCVHVAGVYHFLQIGEQEGYEAIFMGPAVSVDRLFSAIEKYKPDIVGVSYRLTPENVIPLLDEIEKRAEKLDYSPIWDFGGTKPVAEVAKKYKMFSYISDGYDDVNDTIRFFRGETNDNSPSQYGANLTERLQKSYPYPLLRHHFGLPSMDATAEGIEKIAEAKVLDIVSLGPDQNAQQYFFDKDNMKPEYDGAGGVPLRTYDDFVRLKKASRRGNYPLMRCYSGTEDVFKYAPMLVDTIDNAWTAIPIYWYNELDGRGTRSIEHSIREAQQLIKWHAERGIPVECNEPHHWSLRDAHDVMPVVTAYIAAYNAKKLGVKTYISQYMFNVPNGISFPMDLARVLAMMELVESLHDENFTTIRQTRAGLPLLNADLNVAKGQLAASTFMQMCIKPHIIHVVGYCEADHAASPEEVIESCKIVRGVIRHTINQSFSMDKDPEVVKRKQQLISEAHVVLDFIRERYPDSPDPLTDPEILADIVKRGFLDAVHIVKNERFKGTLHTEIRNGACVAVDKDTKEIICEKERLYRLCAEDDR